MNPVDLEFPLAGDLVGFNFSAGGDYDPSKYKDKDKRGTKIMCTISGTGLAATDSSVFDIPNPSEVTLWSVNFTIPGPDPYMGCTVTAKLSIDGIAYTNQDSASNITVGGAPAQSPGGTIITLPPPPP